MSGPQTNNAHRQKKMELKFIRIAPNSDQLVEEDENGIPHRQKRHRACDTCKRKKTKCQIMPGEINCRKCIKAGKDCTYEMMAKLGRPRKGLASTPEDQPKRLETIIDEKLEERESYEDDIPTNPSSPEENNDNTIEDYDDYTIDMNNDNVVEESSNVMQKREIPDLNDYYNNVNVYRRFSNEPPYTRGNSSTTVLMEGKHFIEEPETRHGLDNGYNEQSNYYIVQRASTDEDKRELQINELKVMGIIGPNETINGINQWIYKVSGIDRTLSDRLLKIYFAYIHPLLPVINKTEFLEQYRGIRSSFPAGYLLNAVYGAAVRYVENCKKFNDLDSIDDGGAWDFPDDFSESLFEKILTYLRGKYAPQVSIIQSIIIAHNHSANLDNWESSWLLNCAAVRISQELGLHRATNSRNITEEEKETRKMVWWSAYVLDRWFAASSGRPLTISDSDCDTEYPSVNVKVSEVMDIKTEIDQNRPRFPTLTKVVANDNNEIPLKEPFIQLLKLSEILGFVLQNLYTPKAKRHSARYGSDSIVAHVSDSLSKWRSALPPLLEISKARKKTVQNKDHDPLISVSGFICLSYCTVLILLHRPFIKNTTYDERTKEKSKSVSQNSLSICTSAAIRIVEVAESMHYRDFLLVSWGFALYPVFTAALIHVYNCSNSDSSVSSVAKSHLLRAIAVMKKLCVLSPISTDMGVVLKKVINSSSIFVNDPEFVSMVNVGKTNVSEFYTHMADEAHKRHYAHQDRSKKVAKRTAEDPPIAHKRAIKREKIARESVEDNESIDYKTTNSSIDEKSLGGYTPTEIADLLTASLMDVYKDDLNKQKDLSKQLQQLKSVTRYNYHQPIDKPNIALRNDTNVQRYNQSSSQNEQTHSENNLVYFNHHTIPTSNTASHNLATSSSFDFNNDLLSSTPIDHVTPFDLLNSLPDGLFESQPLMVPGFIGNGIEPCLDGAGQQDSSAIFRHSPDNPFWAIPTSMDMDEWTTYLLPYHYGQVHL